MTARREGSALFTVIAATAALAVPVSLMVLQAGAAYHADVYRADRIQAQALVQALWLQVADALASGEISLPGRTDEILVVNGVVQPAGPTGAVGRFGPTFELEAADPRSNWPPLTGAPAGSAGPLGVGASFTLRRVRGPRGEARGRTLQRDGSAMLEGIALVWFRHARVESRTRFLVGTDGARWLD